MIILNVNFDNCHSVHTQLYTVHVHVLVVTIIYSSVKCAKGEYM